MSTDPTIRRAAPEALLVQNPTCCMCSEEVTTEGDDWFCQNCNAYWSFDDPDTGTWYDDTAEQCTATHQPYLDNPKIPEERRGTTVRCLLDAGHDGDEHRAGTFLTWNTKKLDPWAKQAATA